MQHDYVWAVDQLKLHGVTVDFQNNVISHPGFTAPWLWGANYGNVSFIECVRNMVKDMEKC